MSDFAYETMPAARNPVYIDRIERKYLLQIGEDRMAGLWQDLTSFLSPYGLKPIQEITCVETIYFDNKDYDLLRYILLIRRCHVLVRVRAYESYGRPEEPISEYWMEVKNRSGERRKKRRFRMKKATLREFMDGRDVLEDVVLENEEQADLHTAASLYSQVRETFFTWGLRPALFVTYKRVAFQNGNERLSLDWDIQYYPANGNFLMYDSWKYPIEPAAGKAREVVLEFKYPDGALPGWVLNLPRRYPIAEKNYVKPVEGMGFLFDGPLRFHREAHAFRRMIDAYKAETGPGLNK
jgi:hypothetical protein